MGVNSPLFYIMKLFGDTPQEKAMATLIHDSNGGLGMLSTSLWMIRERLKELNIEDESLEEGLQYIDKAKKRTLMAIDTYYGKFKVDFKEDA
jgi:cation transport regulator ChaC